MTKAETSPVTRLVIGDRGKELVVRVEGRTVTMRPKRTAVGGPAEVTVSWATMYERALIKTRVEALPARRRRGHAR